MMKNNVKIIAPIFVLIVFFSSIDAFASPTEIYLDGRRLLYEMPAGPAPANGFPMIMFLHGATGDAERWFSGADYETQKVFVQMALARGYVVVAPDSRDDVTPPTAPSALNKRWHDEGETLADSLDLPFFEDILTWAGSTNVNMWQGFSLGVSSGGRMTSRNAQYFGSRLAGAVVISAGDSRQIEWPEDGDLFNPDVYDFTSPLTFESNHSPVLVITAEEDWIIPDEVGLHYYSELTAGGVDATMYYYVAGQNPAGDHAWGPWTEGYHDDMLDWLDAHQVPEPSTVCIIVSAVLGFAAFRRIRVTRH